MKKLLLTGVIACCCTTAFAERVGGVGAKLSTLGFGLEYSVPVHQKLDIGLGVNYFNYSRDFEKDGLKLDSKVRLFSFGPVAYVYPWDNGFNLNAGLLYNGNRVKANVQPKLGSITTKDGKVLETGKVYRFDGEDYSIDDVQNASGEIKTNKFAPYLGVGYKSGDRSQNGFAFDANLGVMFQGTPKLDLNVTCSEKLKQLPGACDGLKENVAKQQAKFNNDIKKFRAYPVVSVGFIYRF